MQFDYSYKAIASIPRLISVEFFLSICASAIKRDLLDTIIDHLKNGEDPPNDREFYLNLVELSINLDGLHALTCKNFEPDYESVIGGHDRCLKILHETWVKLFPENPDFIELPMKKQLSTEGITRALCRSYIDGYMDEEESILEINGSDILLYAIDRYINDGESDAENVDDVSDELWSQAETLVNTYFGILGSEFSF